MMQIAALRSLLEKQPTDLRQKTYYFGDRTPTSASAQSPRKSFLPKWPFPNPGLALEPCLACGESRCTRRYRSSANTRLSRQSGVIRSAQSQRRPIQVATVLCKGRQKPVTQQRNQSAWASQFLERAVKPGARLSNLTAIESGRFVLMPGHVIAVPLIGNTRKEGF